MSVLVQSPRPDAVLIDIDGVLTESWSLSMERSGR